MIRGFTLPQIRASQTDAPDVKSTDLILVSDTNDNYRCAKISEITSAVCGGSISIIKPRTDHGIHLFLEVFTDVNCINKINQFDTSDPTDRSSVYIFQTDKWYSFPESGAGALFNNYPVVVYLNDKGLNTGERLYLRYSWYSLPDKSDASDWFSLIYPALSETGANGEDYVNKTDFLEYQRNSKNTVYCGIAELTASTENETVTIVLDSTKSVYILNANTSCSYEFDSSQLDLLDQAAEFEVYIKILDETVTVTGPSTGITYIATPDYTPTGINTIVYMNWKMLTIGGVDKIYCHNTNTIIS